MGEERSKLLPAELKERLNSGSVLDMQGWSKAAKPLEQETVNENGQELFVHDIER